MPRLGAGAASLKTKIDFFQKPSLAQTCLPCEVVLLQLLEYPESDIFVLLVPASNSILVRVHVADLEKQRFFSRIIHQIVLKQRDPFGKSHSLVNMEAKGWHKSVLFQVN